MNNLNIPEDAKKIIELIEENVEVRQVAEIMGFKDLKDLADHMKTLGFSWSNEEGNYLLNGEVDYYKKEEDLGDYLDFIRELYERKEDLFAGERGVKRYTVPGLVRTKAVYMSHNLAKLAKDFSQANNLSQREVYEGALIEYLSRHGFSKKVDEIFRLE